MRIIVQPKTILSASLEIQNLSRKLRRACAEIEDAARGLQPLSELDACRLELAQQEEAAALMAVRLAGLSDALSNIAEIYGRVEEQNETQLQHIPVGIR